MSFLSLHFLLFLFVVFLLAWRYDQQVGPRNNILLVASYYFYMCWDWRFASLLLVNAIVNFYAAKAIAASGHAGRRRVALIVALSVTLGLLAYFKYMNFFIQGAVELLRAAGFHADLPALQLILPIGISFYTFQALSYTLDVYRRKEEPCRSLRDFALFVSFFPTVLSGPITRGRQLLPQLAAPTVERPEQVESGLLLILRGYVKKVAFADVLALHLVNPAFANPSGYSGWFLLLAVYGYSFQIYMDLSGYTDIARGVARLLGFELPVNFNRPYLADSISNFWQRWHITMSSFFRDYLYFSVGGSKYGNVYLNLLITFVAIGLWHGAGWNFIVYGLVHGSVVGVERWARERRARRGLPALAGSGAWWLLRVFVVFHIVALSRILFRARDLDSAVHYAREMLRFSAAPAPIDPIMLGILTLAVLLHYLPLRWSDGAMGALQRQPAWMQAGIMVLVVYALVVLFSADAPFVYFQF